MGHGVDVGQHLGRGDVAARAAYLTEPPGSLGTQEAPPADVQAFDLR
jgi:hypothetical protein